MPASVARRAMSTAGSTPSTRMPRSLKKPSSDPSLLPSSTTSEFGATAITTDDVIGIGREMLPQAERDRGGIDVVAVLDLRIADMKNMQIAAVPAQIQFQRHRGRGIRDRRRRRRAPGNSACRSACPPSARPVPACRNGRAGRCLACGTGFSWRAPKISESYGRRIPRWRIRWLTDWFGISLVGSSPSSSIGPTRHLPAIATACAAVNLPRSGTGQPDDTAGKADYHADDTQQKRNGSAFAGATPASARQATMAPSRTPQPLIEIGTAVSRITGGKKISASSTERLALQPARQHVAGGRGRQT